MGTLLLQPRLRLEDGECRMADDRLSAVTVAGEWRMDVDRKLNTASQSASCLAEGKEKPRRAYRVAALGIESGAFKYWYEFQSQLMFAKIDGSDSLGVV